MKNDSLAESDSQGTQTINNSLDIVDINNEKQLDHENKNFKGRPLGVIPFINKQSKDQKEDIDCNVINNNKKLKDLNYDSPDEIDMLVSKIGKTKGLQVKIEDKGKLDFDEDEKKYKMTNNGNSLITSIFTKKSENSNSLISPVAGENVLNKNSDKKFVKNENLEESNLNLNKKTNQIQTIFSKDNTITSSKSNITINIQVNSNSNLNPKNSAPKKIQNIKENVIKTPQNNLFINPYEVNNQEFVLNGDLILCILELCINSNDYGFKYKSKSRAFWEEIFKRDNLKNIFVNFKPDTLKKYWSILSDVKEYKRVVDIINQYKEIIDNEEVKLLPLISTLADYIKNKKDNLETALIRMIKKDNRKTHNFLGNKRGMDDEIREIEELDLGKDLRKNSVNPEDDPLLLDDDTMAMLIQDEQKKKGHTITPKDSTPVIKNRVIFPNDKDKVLFCDIDYIIQGIQTYLNLPRMNSSFSSDDSHQEHLTKEEIMEILKRTSFNIENTYLYFNDRNTYKYLLFSDMEDYIIKNMRKTDYYKDLVEIKGKELVEERERFLVIDDE